MGHKRNLWSSIRTDTKRPARKRITKSRGYQADEEEETPGTSSSYDAPSRVSSTPLSKTSGETPQEKNVQTPMSIVVQHSVQEVHHYVYGDSQQSLSKEQRPMQTMQQRFKEESQLPLQLKQPAVELEPSMQEIMHLSITTCQHAHSTKQVSITRIYVHHSSN